MHVLSRAIPLLSLLLLFSLTACETAIVEADAPLQAEATFSADAKSPVGGKIAAQLAQVKRLTASFHDFESGVAAGWDAPLSDCVEIPGVGGMGYHYGNMKYVDDGGSLDVMEPEVLLYEPQKNGKMRLVGVEYIVPVYPPDATGPFERPQGDAPVLLDQEFHWNPMLGLWALHAWIWRDNPTGLFEDFNPKVSCAFAESEE